MIHCFDPTTRYILSILINSVHLGEESYDTSDKCSADKGSNAGQTALTDKYARCTRRSVGTGVSANFRHDSGNKGGATGTVDR